MATRSSAARTICYVADLVGKESDTPERGSARRLRSDALANRERVLAAAVTAVLREGCQVPMATIAAAAGVGIGTLYRCYPTCEALLEALTLRAFPCLSAGPEPAPRNQNFPCRRYLDSQADQLAMDPSGFSRASPRGCRRYSMASWWRKIKIFAVFHVSSRPDSPATRPVA